MNEIKKHKGLTYRNAGVDVEKGDAFVAGIKEIVRSTHIPGVDSEIGAFAGTFDFSAYAQSQPRLIACTDGVGTKLKYAFEMNRHSTVGIDLVAMNVNDLLVTGARPLFFLDYIATGHLEPESHMDIVRGIAEGCRQSECALLGGETAEMPGMYPSGEYDLAGFAVGIVDLPKMKTSCSVRSGDCLLGLPSSGIHSNGYSLVRMIFQDRDRFPLESTPDGLREPLGETLLKPTMIYWPHFKRLDPYITINSAAHITGGGITGNLPRALPSNLGADIYLDQWSVPPIFKMMQALGRIDDAEMYKTFNMGIGMILVVPESESENALAIARSIDPGSSLIGRVSDRSGIRYHSQTAKSVGKTAGSSVKHRPRIAIFGSGRGSNMASLCEAIDRGDLPAEIGCVLSNNSGAYILQRATDRGIPAYHVSTRTLPDAEAREQYLLELLNTHRIDLICLAGYMRKIPPKIIRQFHHRILNIHPALLPAFGGKGMFGMAVHSAVIRSGAKYSGVTVHLVDEEYDTGRIIAQKIVPVLESDTPAHLAERVLTVEHQLYWQTVRDHLWTLETRDR